jgi:hypothetical protein
MKPFKRRYARRSVIVGLFGLTAIPLLAASSCDTATGTNPTNTPTSANNSTSAPATAKPKATAVPVAARKVTGVAKTLGAGTFTASKDVAVGLYVVTAGPGQTGNFIVSGTDSYNEILGGGGSLGVPKVRVQISTGDQIQISGLSVVHFAPVSSPFLTTHTTTTLYAGTFIVGQDIGVGRYVATPGAGQSGNFIVSGNDSYNEILGGSSSFGGVPNVTVSLSNGDIVDISGLSQVTMTASS